MLFRYWRAGSVVVCSLREGKKKMSSKITLAFGLQAHDSTVPQRGEPKPNPTVWLS